MTIRDIAQVFDVAEMTVSKALNFKGGVSQEKAQAIRAHAKKVGYRPSHAARTLMRGRTHTVGLCVREDQDDKPWGYPWLYDLIREIGLELKKNDIHLHTAVAAGGAEEVKAVIDRFLEVGVESMIIGPLGFCQEYEALAAHLRHSPHVIAFDTLDQLPIDRVYWDVYAGGQLVAEHLLDLGHQDILLLGASDYEAELNTTPTKLRGVLDKMTERGIRFREDRLIPLHIRTEIRPVLEEAFAGHDRPTAIVAHNDWIAMYAIQQLAEMGLRVPVDISVVGFDDIPASELCTPALTTVSYDIEAYARQIAHIVADRVEHNFGGGNSRRSPETISEWCLSPRLLERQSCARPSTFSS